MVHILLPATGPSGIWQVASGGARPPGDALLVLAMSDRAPVTREALLAAQQARPPFGGRTFTAAEPAVRLGVSGSGDDLLLLVWTATDLAREIAAGVRLLSRLGIRAGTRVANTLAGALATPGSLLLGDVNEAIGALDVPLGPSHTDAAAKAAWELLDRVRCEVLVVDPATAPRFFGMMPPDERPWLAGIVWLWRAGVPQPPEAPWPFAGWQRRWFAVPEVASFAGATCAAGGLHLDDALDGIVRDGQLVLAPRDASAAPYATGLAARLDPGCPCGTPAFVLGP